jgi:hypothetical protein
MLPTETPPDRRRKFTVIAGGKKLNLLGGVIAISKIRGFPRSYDFRFEGRLARKMSERAIPSCGKSSTCWSSPT